MIKFPKLKKKEFYFWNCFNKQFKAIRGKDLALLDKLIDGNIFKKDLDTEEVEFRFAISFYFMGKDSFDFDVASLSKIAQKEYDKNLDGPVMACSFLPVVKYSYDANVVSYMKNFIFFEDDADQVEYLLRFLRKIFFAKGISADKDSPPIGIFSDRGFLKKDEDLYTRIQRDLRSQGL